jgi:hypothetical protein
VHLYLFIISLVLQLQLHYGIRFRPRTLNETVVAVFVSGSDRLIYFLNIKIKSEFRRERRSGAYNVYTFKWIILNYRNFKGIFDPGFSSRYPLGFWLMD